MLWENLTTPDSVQARHKLPKLTFQFSGRLGKWRAMKEVSEAHLAYCQPCRLPTPPLLWPLKDSKDTSLGETSDPKEPPGEDGPDDAEEEAVNTGQETAVSPTEAAETGTEEVFSFEVLEEVLGERRALSLQLSHF